jgi:pyruvate dehydrogenase E2 component (dihydrolipoamide acetyltransferase)
MPKQIRMPKLSDTMEEGRLIAWRKKVGDPVKRGEVLAEIETDKADMEFEAYTEGTLAQILVDAGATVPVGTLIAVLRLPGEAEGAVAAEEAPAAQPKAEPAARRRPPRRTRADRSETRGRDSPRARAGTGASPRPAPSARASSRRSSGRRAHPRHAARAPPGEEVDHLRDHRQRPGGGSSRATSRAT